MSDTATCCIVYTTDPTYLFPTLVSAIQARSHSSADRADVAIFCLNLDGPTRAVFEPICALERIALIALDTQVIEGQSAMISRLFLTRFIPERYTDYLYLDGDIQVLGSLDPLIATEVPDGYFLAVNDPLTFLLKDISTLSNRLRQHLYSLGLTEAESLSYFNSGVLRIKAKGWKELGLQAWQHFQDLGRTSRFPDQDALNLAGRFRRLPISLAWNYPAFLRNARVESEIRPRIKHFMSSPKPWNGSFPPWTDAECQPYRQMIQKYPALTPFQPPAFSSRTHAAYRLQQHAKRATELVTWGLSKRRNRILDYEAAYSSLPQAGAERLTADVDLTMQTASL